jgi:two-component system, OmpR family, response regulator VicR
MEQSQQSILLLEDDPNLGLVVQENLEMRGYAVTLAVDGIKGLAEYDRQKFDLCLVDIMMPKLDGFSFAKEIRARDSKTPIIFLTARSLKKDRIEGFEIGADDYITKPFSMEELVLRIRAVLRRSAPPQSGPPGSIVTIGKFLFDSSHQTLFLGGKKQKLTTKESELLKLLCANMNAIVARDTALGVVWGSDSYFASRSMDVYISRLRTCLKKDSSVEIITVHGKGFRLVVKS